MYRKQNASPTCLMNCGPNTNCLRACVDTESHTLNCGGCGIVCSASEVCVDSACRDYTVGVGCTACPCAACPAGEFAAPPASGAVLYVSATATAPGDGSAAAPFDSLSRAAAAVRSGTTILLGKGTHEGEVQPPAGSTLRGACASETTLTPSFPHESAPTILVERADVTVSAIKVRAHRGYRALRAKLSETRS